MLSSLWEDGYFAESVGLKNEKVIREYIKTKEKFPKSFFFICKRPRLLSRGLLFDKY